MLCLLHHIPTEETIRYALGCAVPKPVDPQWLSKAQTAQQQVLQSSQPRFCWRVFPSAPLLEQLLTGQDIRSHLSGCTDCILLAATLGARGGCPDSPCAGPRYGAGALAGCRRLGSH